MRNFVVLFALCVHAWLVSSQGTCSCSFCVGSTCADFTSVCTELPGKGTTTCSGTKMTCSIPACNPTSSTSDASMCKQVCATFGCPSSSWQCSAVDDDDVFDDDEGLNDENTVVVGLEEEKKDNTCFHADTTITYKGRKYNVTQLLNGAEPECTVPHMPTARGVVVSTNCGKRLRVTETHLVATPRGFQLAHTLRRGDLLFGDMDGEAACAVVNVEREAERQRYFGLNCVHSEVLANGLRTSTFGDFHTLPSWYMYYAGLALGPEAAARLGDAVADVFLGLLVDK